MTANLEMDLAGVGVEDMPDDADLVAVEGIAHAEGEVVRIDFLRLLGRFEGEGDLTLILGDELEVGVAGETVTWEVILAAIDDVGVVVHTADNWE